MTMLDVALRCIQRGWATFPCVPKAKNPIIPREKGGHGYKDATTDEAQVRAWWAEYPNANVPIATGASKIVVVDFDAGIRDEEHLKAWMLEHGFPMTYAVRSGHRPEFRVHLYYNANGLKLRSVPWEKWECSGDVRGATGLVIAPGGQHKSGELYTELWGIPLADVPEAVQALTSKERAFDSSAAVSEETREEWHTWLLEYADRNKLELTGFEAAVDNGYKVGVVCPWWEHHSSGSRGTDSSTILGMFDGLLYFICAHGTCGHSNEDFKQLMRLQNGENTPEPGAGPTVSFGSGNVSVTLDADDFEAPAEDTARPVYPDDEWKGTPYGDFADYCSNGNFIPKRFFSEALRTVVGAVVGGQLSTDYQGVNPRSDTVLIGPPGSGKGTAITAARQFVECEFDSQRRSSERPLLWDDAHDPLNWCWPSRYIGAHVVSPASAPGLIEATKPHKLEKGESRSPLELWRELPRFITIQEEIGGLFANFANENSGRGLETAILELYDRESFTTTATNGRAAKSGRLLYSVLGGIPKKEWERIFARSSSVGSGLFSRLNIIGTENERTVAGLPEYDFGEMQRRFLPRITALERTPARIPLSPNGRALLNEWFTRVSAELKELEVPSARLNIHALRVALHLAWLRGHANILESDVDSGIKVANFQAKMREFYLPAEGDNPDAQLQARIMQVMKAKRSLPYRELQRRASASRAGVIAWERAIAGLVRDGRIALVNEVTKAGQKRKVVKLLKGKD
jgi:hypothetical protein